MKIVIGDIKKIVSSRKVRGRLFAITLMTSVFFLLVTMTGSNNRDVYVVDKSGNVTGIERGETDSPAEYSFTLKIVNGNDISEKNITINKKAADKATGKKQINEENSNMERDAEISGIVSDIETSDSDKIFLPDRLSDGSRLYWSINKEGINSATYIMIVYVILILLVIKSELDSANKTNEVKRKNIIKNLPRFTNQLMLMLNGGLILNDAFNRITFSYTQLGAENMDWFQSELVKLNERNIDNRISTATLINEFAGRNNVKELVRIATILLENEKRGTPIVDNLERESRYLWDDRKIIARENGKMIDTRMAYPMGLLLVVLIIITMAPALLNL